LSSWFALAQSSSSEEDSGGFWKTGGRLGKDCGGFDVYFFMVKLVLAGPVADTCVVTVELIFV